MIVEKIRERRRWGGEHAAQAASTFKIFNVV